MDGLLGRLISSNTVAAKRPLAFSIASFGRLYQPHYAALMPLSLGDDLEHRSRVGGPTLWMKIIRQSWYAENLPPGFLRLTIVDILYFSSFRSDCRVPSCGILTNIKLSIGACCSALRPALLLYLQDGDFNLFRHHRTEPQERVTTLPLRPCPLQAWSSVSNLPFPQTGKKQALQYMQRLCL